MEGYTARDALIVMRLDFSEALQEIDEEISKLDETLEFTGIASQMLHDDSSLTQFPAIKHWLETVSNLGDLQRDREELHAERDELLNALTHLEERLKGTGRS